MLEDFIGCFSLGRLVRHSWILSPTKAKNRARKRALASQSVPYTPQQ
ncbi:MAG TPA: hypothetical protein VGE89_11940 [Bryobacteraceae bacterium]|jgi:hypothetical protein